MISWTLRRDVIFQFLAGHGVLLTYDSKHTLTAHNGTHGGGRAIRDTNDGCDGDHTRYEQ